MRGIDQIGELLGNIKFSHYIHTTHRKYNITRIWCSKINVIRRLRLRSQLQSQTLVISEISLLTSIRRENKNHRDKSLS